MTNAESLESATLWLLNGGEFFSVRFDSVCSHQGPGIQKAAVNISIIDNFEENQVISRYDFRKVCSQPKKLT